MRDRKALFGSAIAALTLAGSLFAAVPAGATQSSPGSCPSSFDPATVKQVQKLASTTDASALDKNGNGWLCLKSVGNSGFNAIDDKV